MRSMWWLRSNVWLDTRGSAEKAIEEGRRLERARLELRMVLRANEEWVTLELEDLHPLALGVPSHEFQALGLQLTHVVDVDLVAVAVALVEGQLAPVKAARLAIRPRQLSSPGPQPHRTAHVSLRALRHEEHHRVRRALVELRRVGFLLTAHVARELDHRNLEPEAHAEVWLAILARILGSGYLTLDSSVAKAAWHEDAVAALELRPALSEALARLVVSCEGLRLDPVNHQLALALVGGVVERLRDGEVGVRQVCILAHYGNSHWHVERVDELGEGTPLIPQVGTWAREQLEARQHVVGHVLGVEEHRHAVDVGEVVYSKAVLGRHVAEVCKLLFGRLAERLRGAADEEIWGEASGAQILHAVLRRLSLLLTNRAEDGHQGDMEEEDVVAANAELELAESLDEGHGLDVADCAAKLNDAHVGLARQSVSGHLGDPFDPLHDGVGHVRDHLHGLAQVIAAPLLLQALLVDLARGDVVVACEGELVETLVVPQIEVHFPAVVESKHLAVLKRRHRTGVYVEVRVNLNRGHSVARRAHEHTDRRGGHAFAEAGDNAAGHDNVLHRCHRRAFHASPSRPRGRRERIDFIVDGHARYLALDSVRQEDAPWLPREAVRHRG
mmetsp:Transcript_49930/g.99399  ORF Transcript_49930/g.99399 Transcript_49930/m.99399 type:complete len:615 (-) Transcript_49930:262-2106(-)